MVESTVERDDLSAWKQMQQARQNQTATLLEDSKDESEDDSAISAWKQMQQARQNQTATLLEEAEKDTAISAWQQMQQARQNKIATLLEDSNDDEDTSGMLSSGISNIESTGGESKPTRLVYKLVTIRKVKQIEYFDRLLLPHLKQRCKKLLESASLKGVVAYIGDRKVGLILANISVKTQTAEIVSWLVLPKYRCRGIGSKLVRCLEKYLLKISCKSLTLNYEVGRSSCSTLESMLQKLKWQQPIVKSIRLKSNADAISRAPWFNNFSLPKGFSVAIWDELKTRDLDIFLKHNNNNNSIVLLGKNEKIERLNSLGLFYQDRLIGWIINHRIATDTIRYSSLYIHPDFSKSNLKIALVSESIQRQINSFVSYGDFNIIEPTAEIISSIHRHLKPYTTSFYESRQIHKKLLPLSNE